MRRTLETFALQVLLAFFVLPAWCAAQTVLWSDDFEIGHEQWSKTGFWHWIRDTNPCAAAVLPFPSSTHCMWYGIDGQCNFDNGQTNGGVLKLLQPVALPGPGQTAVLRYKWWRQAEGCGSAIGSPYDWSSVLVYVNGVLTSEHLECASAAAWRKGRVDLTPYMGTGVSPQFFFDSSDNELNATLGWMVDDVAIQLEAGSSYCEDSGCPCATSGSALHTRAGGCLNSTSVLNGSELWGSGTPSVANDDVALTIEGMPASSFITFLQGDLFSSGVVFGDGVRCVGGNLLRLGTKSAVDGVASYPEPLDELLSVKGMIPPAGITVGYQGHYRDNGDHCTSATFNLSNGYKVAWIP